MKKWFHIKYRISQTWNVEYFDSCFVQVPSWFLNSTQFRSKPQKIDGFASISLCHSPPNDIKRGGKMLRVNFIFFIWFQIQQKNQSSITLNARHNRPALDHRRKKKETGSGFFQGRPGFEIWKHKFELFWILKSFTVVCLSCPFHFQPTLKKFCLDFELNKFQLVFWLNHHFLLLASNFTPYTRRLSLSHIISHSNDSPQSFTYDRRRSNRSFVHNHKS